LLQERFFHISSSHLAGPKVLAFPKDAQSSLFSRLIRFDALHPAICQHFAAYRSTFHQNQLEMLERTVLE